MIESLKLILAKVKTLLKGNAEMDEIKERIAELKELLNDVNTD